VRKKPELKKIATGLLAVLTLQVFTGAVTVQFDWPLLAAVAHNAGAALLVCLLAMLNYRLSFAGQSALTEQNKAISPT
jgi:cytochrome c oxidase assembly protein subunit 15